MDQSRVRVSLDSKRTLNRPVRPEYLGSFLQILTSRAAGDNGGGSCPIRPSIERRTSLPITFDKTMRKAITLAVAVEAKTGHGAETLAVRATRRLGYRFNKKFVFAKIDRRRAGEESFRESLEPEMEA